MMAFGEPNQLFGLIGGGHCANLIFLQFINAEIAVDERLLFLFQKLFDGSLDFQGGGPVTNCLIEHQFQPLSATQEFCTFALSVFSESSLYISCNACIEMAVIQTDQIEMPDWLF